MKKIKYIILFILISITLTGCKNQQNTNEDSLTILTTSINYENFIKAFNEKYPDIEIEFISYKGYNQTGYIRECFETGELPDIVTTTSFIDEELQKEQLADLSKYSFVNNFSDSWLNKCNVNGSIYLLPSNYSAIGFYYNKTIMDRYGWELPHNFEELKELSVKIEEAGLETCLARMDLEGFIFSDFFGLGNTFYFNTEKGAKWKNDFLSGQATATGNIEPVLSYFMEWVEQGYISPEDINVKSNSDKFYRGECVFMLCNGIGYEELEIDGIGKMEYGILPWLSPQGESNMIVSNVSRYYGINKKLEEKGQKKKLEEALCLMEFMSSEEGMSLLKTDTTAISPLNTWEINEDGMYYEIKDYIIGGNSVPLVYAGWEDLIIPMADELYALMRKEQTVEQCAKEFDSIRNRWLRNGPESMGYIEETISKEDTAYIVGRILMEQNEADAALISLGEYHGFGKENLYGIQCGIYPGEFNLDRMRTIVPAGNMCTVTMSGKDILEMEQTGQIIQFQSDVKESSFPYVLITNHNMELEDENMYQLVIAEYALSEEQRERIVKQWTPVESQNMMEEYFTSLKTPISKDLFYQW